MEPLDRRSLLGGAALAGAGMAASQTVAAPNDLKLSEIKKEADVACLYHCDFGEPPRFTQMVNNIGNHFGAYGASPLDVQLCVVAHSAGIKFFLETLAGTPWSSESLDAAIFKRVADQAKNGLKVYLCEITFKRFDLDKKLARNADFISFVPSGVATVAALQSKGFAYLKVG